MLSICRDSHYARPDRSSRWNAVIAPWFHRRARSLRDRGASSHRIDVVVMTAVSFNNVLLIEGDGGVSEKKSRELPPPPKGGGDL